MDSQSIIAIASSISTIGVALLYWQARILTTQLKADHERSRRESAIDMLKVWDNGLNQNDGVARKFVECLNFNQAKAIFNQESFSVDSKYWPMVRSIIPENSKLKDFDPEGTSQLKIDDNDSAYIRWLMVSYLNRAETILSAWRHNIADKSMIEEQFSYLVKPEEGHYLLRNFRKAAGSAYPSLEAFVEHLERESKVSEGKPKVA